jgi:hypothetical protein
MNGLAAQEVLSVGRDLVAPDVADEIIRFVAESRAVRSGSVSVNVEQLEVEPALLSIMCSELNRKRRALGEARITTDLLDGSQARIISDFYERAVSKLTLASAFIEENLITDEGFRIPIARERARHAGLSELELNELTNKRLIRPIRIGDVDCLELTHDLLTEAVRDSRDQRHKRDIERTRAQTRAKLAWLRTVATLFIALFLVTTVAFIVLKTHKTRVELANRLAGESLALWKTKNYDEAMLRAVAAYQAAPISSATRALF